MTEQKYYTLKLYLLRLIYEFEGVSPECQETLRRILQ
jgi:hypothetical protein